MKVEFMRWVDHYIGVPLCFILSMLVSIERLAGLRIVKGKPKKILFIELSEMGSTILAYSAMKKAKELFNAQIYFLIFEENVESIKLLGVVPKENVITIRSSSIFSFFVDAVKAIFKMRSIGIDTVIDLELFSRVTSILSFFSGARAIVGFYRYDMEGLYRGNFQTHKVEYNPHQHIAQSFMSMVYALAGEIDEIPMVKKEIRMDEVYTAKVTSSAEERKKILEKLRAANPSIKEGKIILLNPNASQLLPIRKWPLERFQKLALKLTKDGYFVVITGTNSEKGDAKAICDYVQSDSCIDFTGKTTFKELIDLYNTANVLVTNDSGPAHFASLTDIFIAVIFGPETPKIYSPLSKNCVCVYSNFACSPCVSAYNHRKTPCKDSKCLAAISVDDVYKVVKSKL